MTVFDAQAQLHRIGQCMSLVYQVWKNKVQISAMYLNADYPF